MMLIIRELLFTFLWYLCVLITRNLLDIWIKTLPKY